MKNDPTSTPKDACLFDLSQIDDDDALNKFLDDVLGEEEPKEEAEDAE